MYYASSTNFTLDNTANDGASGEQDNVQTDLEKIADGPGKYLVRAKKGLLIRRFKH